MIFDTDVLIWLQRGSTKAARLIDSINERSISIQTYMELLQGAQTKLQHKTVRGFLLDYDFRTLPFSENIGHRAAIYVEEYAISSGLRAADAIIAATAVENNQVLSTGNVKHFKAIKDLEIKAFKV